MTQLRTRWERLLGTTESPIERAFLSALCEGAFSHGYELAKTAESPAWTIVIQPQKSIGRYRVDFLVQYPFFGDKVGIVVECDGHEFHSRTKKQAQRDRSRDRFLQRLGYKVFRFTGSEIHANPKDCAADVLNTIMDFQTATIVKAMGMAA